MFSVIITHFKREANLVNTLNGLCKQSLLPHEVIVIEMGDCSLRYGTYPFTLNIIRYDGSWSNMPLAAARNLGADHAVTEHLIFLDVDCIPSTTFCEKMYLASVKKDALIMGSPRYLLHNSVNTEFEALAENSTLHPSRPEISELRKECCYELFWSLCFSIPKEAFGYVGGFDDSYEGYGGEDTDFALEVKKAGILFYLSEAEVYHQQHPVYIPPLNHLEAIVKNSNIFYSKWNYWPMADCLLDFASMGYIHWNETKDTPVDILSMPTNGEIQSRLIKNAPYR